MSETQQTDADDSDSSIEPDDFEIMEDAATLAYAVYRRVDFDAINASREFDDEFVGYIESAAQTSSVMGYTSALADQAEIRALNTMDGDTRDLVHKYDDRESVVRQRRFLRTVRTNPAHVVLEMKHAHSNGGDN